MVNLAVVSACVLRASTKEKGRQLFLRKISAPKRKSWLRLWLLKTRLFADDHNDYVLLILEPLCTYLLTYLLIQLNHGPQGLWAVHP